jgi:hypothetical protein
MASDRQFRMDSFVDSSVRETPGQFLAHDEIDTSETVKKQKTGKCHKYTWEILAKNCF